jgi:hypothetical protein
MNYRNYIYCVAVTSIVSILALTGIPGCVQREQGNWVDWEKDIFYDHV